jgi:hypothetical protein
MCHFVLVLDLEIKFETLKSKTNSRKLEPCAKRIDGHARKLVEILRFRSQVTSR